MGKTGQISDKKLYTPTADRRSEIAVGNLLLRTSVIGHECKDWKAWAKATGDEEIIEAVNQVFAVLNKINTKVYKRRKVEGDGN